MPEGEQLWGGGGGAEVIWGGNMPPPIGIGLTDLPYIEGGQCPPLAPWVPASLHIMCLKKWFIFVSSLFFCVRPESNKFQIKSSDILRKTKIFEKSPNFFLTFLSNLKPYGDFFQIFVAFSEYLNFTISTDKIVGDF